MALQAAKLPELPRHRWRVIYAVSAGPEFRDEVEIEALACEVQNGALLFWDGGLKRAWGAGAWLECELLTPGGEGGGMEWKPLTQDMVNDKRESPWPT